MIVYDGTKTEFLESVINDTIAYEVEQRILEKMGKKTGEAEFRSWENSMQHMFKVLSDTSIPNDAGIAIEYNIPQTSKRVDFIITGYDNSEKPNAVIIELKQWDQITEIDGPDALVETYTGGGLRRVVHPSYQVWSYAALIRDYNQSVQDGNIRIFPCAYLHNYKEGTNDPIRATRYQIYIDEAPIFAYGHVKEMRDFIKKSIVTGDKKEILYSIDHGKIRPSKSLQNSIASMLKGNREFIMIDEQKVVYESIIELAEDSLKSKKKRTVIVKGGPGTGKSVIAINLLVELTQRGQFVQYVSKNSAPRTVYQSKLKGHVKKSSVDNMFKGSGIYTEAGENMVHTILVDEAHRLNAKSGMFQNKGENQIKEIIHASFCSVFFIDESQRVTMSDIGSIDEIIKWSKEEGSEIAFMELMSQFRCNGSDGYLAWIDNILEIRETANFSASDMEYDIQIIDDPNELRRLIEEKNNENHRSRLLAGYCWDWNKKEENNTEFHDICIGDFSMSWNLGKSIFAIDDSSINEVGCIHTSQGLEFDYVGVIIGDDLRYENGHIVTDFTKRAKTDQSLKGIKKLYKERPEDALARADEIIKNTYRTLLTRGMKGCYIYCTDKHLRDYLKGCLYR
ncbi:DUF2075 domain-containing protein [Ruminococcus albus]|uniref:Schlafen group 3-like DNA/RNA helicase domain-containing protein n=1 Tax=Ruminococcus albus TaxID=1264 RepID=A0A1H7PJT0_RUMAL|nr:DUF2075 domain-containing protein [Ruminococcus albus]SEL35866.1 hypothetical protein SAMN05216469_12219 [Ruminococcus albus]